MGRVSSLGQPLQLYLEGETETPLKAKDDGLSFQGFSNIILLHDFVFTLSGRGEGLEEDQDPVMVSLLGINTEYTRM